MCAYYLNTCYLCWINIFIHVFNDLNCICILYLRKCWGKTWVDVIDEYELDDELRGEIDREVRVRGGRCENPFSQMMAPSFNKVWMTTTDYSRQSSGTLAGS